MLFLSTLLRAYEQCSKTSALANYPFIIPNLESEDYNMWLMSGCAHGLRLMM